MQYPYPPYYPPPPEPRRRKVDRRLIAALVILAAFGTAALAVVIDHALTRISDQVLTAILTIGCAAGVAFPALAVALAVILRRAENGNGRRTQQAQVMTPPQVMVIPPMAVQPQLPQYGPTPATWEQIPARRFTTIGDE